MSDKAYEQRLSELIPAPHNVPTKISAGLLEFSMTDMRVAVRKIKDDFKDKPKQTKERDRLIVEEQERLLSNEKALWDEWRSRGKKRG